MDQENYDNLCQIRPPAAKAKLVLFLEYARGVKETEVPDPYFGGQDGFYHVIDLVEAASEGLIESLEL